MGMIRLKFLEQLCTNLRFFQSGSNLSLFALDSVISSASPCLKNFDLEQNDRQVNQSTLDFDKLTMRSVFNLDCLTVEKCNPDD